MLFPLPFDFCARLQKMAEFLSFRFFGVARLSISQFHLALRFSWEKLEKRSGKARNGQLQGLIVYENVWEKFSVQSSLVSLPRVSAMHKVYNFSWRTKIDGVCRAQSKFQIQKKERKPMEKGQRGGYGGNDSFCVADTLTLE